MSSMARMVRVRTQVLTSKVAKKDTVEIRTRGQLMIEVDSIKGLTFTSRRIVDVPEPRRKSLVDDMPPIPQMVPPAAGVVGKRF